MRYEEWADDETAVLLPDDANKNRKLSIALLGVPKLVWSVEADSWEEACNAQHEHHGWEPYVPIDASFGADDQ